MGQKVNPNGIRLGIVREWNSKWYASNKKEWALWLGEDYKIRKFLEKHVRDWFISSIIIERTVANIRVIITTTKPGIILGKNGENAKKLEKQLSIVTKKDNKTLKIDINEEKNPDLSALIIANEIAVALENRTQFRIAQKKVIRRVMKAGAKGIKTKVSGRLNGVDMARSEGYSEGVVPLQTFRNNIDYSTANAITTYGVLGVKVWISLGEVLKGDEKKTTTSRRQARPKPTYKAQRSNTPIKPIENNN